MRVYANTFDSIKNSTKAEHKPFQHKFGQKLIK